MGVIYKFLTKYSKIQEERIEKIIVQDGFIEYRIWSPCSICEGGVVFLMEENVQLSILQRQMIQTLYLMINISLKMMTQSFIQKIMNSIRKLLV